MDKDNVVVDFGQKFTTTLEKKSSTTQIVARKRNRFTIAFFVAITSLQFIYFIKLICNKKVYIIKPLSFIFYMKITIYSIMLHYERMKLVSFLLLE